jgi:heptaprenyl diphosphate synthase
VVKVKYSYTDSIINKLNEYANHPFLNKYFELPIISEDKVLFLQGILSQTKLDEEKKEKYVIATMLIQIALDAHELVSNDYHDIMQISKEKRQRQLSILVGDLYSGLFYKILSQVKDIQMINTLASAIKEVNERKMVLYHNDITSINHLFEDVKKIESLLIEKVSGFLNISAFDHIFPNWLLIKRLMKELKSYQKENDSYIIKLLLTRMEEQEILRLLENMISRTAHILENYIMELPNHLSLWKDILLDDLKQQFVRQEILLEEG